MSAPTQQFPPWLSPSPIVETNVAGVPTETETTVVYLPLTYFGPSIPLGTLWIFGSSSSPATTSASTISTASALPITISSTPTAMSTTSVPTATILSSTSTSISLNTAISPSTFSFVPMASTTSAPSSDNGLTKGQLIGVIVAGILGVVFLFVLALAILLWCKGRRNRMSRGRSLLTGPIEKDYFIIGPGGHSPGEGSPRHSGEEADPFLQRRQQEMAQVDTEMGSRPRVVPRVPPPQPGSLSSSNSSSTNNSGYGVLLDRPSLGLLPSTPEGEEESSPTSTAEERGQLENKSVFPSESVDGHEPGEAYAYSESPLLPPPRLLDPERSFQHASATDDVHPVIKSHSSYVSCRSSYPPDADEAATFLTARRVKVDDIIPLKSENRNSPRSRSRMLDSGILGLGLSRLANISRLSWFKSMEVPQTSEHGPTISPYSTERNVDVENGRLLDPSRMIDSQGSRNFAIGLAANRERPVSSVSGTSGGTVYHDARTSLPGTPSFSLRRSLTSSQAAMHMSISNRSSGIHYPVASYQHGRADSPARSHFGQNAENDFDVLDMPAPSAVSPFPSASFHSVRDSLSVSSTPKSMIPYPPGLDMMVTPKVWTDTMSSGNTNPPVTPHQYARIPIDLLEEAPPRAAVPWKAISGDPNGGFIEPTQLLNFNSARYVRHLDLDSEHSMPSYSYPGPPSPSTGSAPAPRQHLASSFGSVSSRPSAHSGAMSGYSELSAIAIDNLANSGSLISQGSIAPVQFTFERNGRPHTPLLSNIGNATPSRRVTPGATCSITSDATAVEPIP